MGCMLSKRQLNEKSDDEINSHAPDSTRERGPVERPNMEAPRSAVDTSAHEPETVLPQSPRNGDTNKRHQPNQPKKLECNICGEPTEEVAIYPCSVCQNPYCISCLKTMFFKACKDETLMPARCCQNVQLSIVLPYLSPEEADMYRAKFEEWNSSDRVYCPVPTCSTFIPSKLYSATILPTPPQSPQEDSEGSGKAVENERQTPNQTVVFGTGIRMEIHTPPQSPASSKCTPTSQSPPKVSCPRCAAQICVSCKQLEHPQRPCSADDLDPELAALLRRWKIKRCPKCRTAVKRMYGCSHILCRCGAQWCWDCLKSIDRCEDGGCAELVEADADQEREDGDDRGGNDAEGETTSDRSATDDLDSEAEDWAASGLNFGDEPSDAMNDPWNCETHIWHRVVRGLRAFAGGRAECHRCWKQVKAAEPLEDGVKVEGGELVTSQSANAAADTTASGSVALPVPENAAYHCVYCGLIHCPTCKTVDTWNSQ